MSLLDELRAYLERVSSPNPLFTPDVAAHRRALIEALEELERQGESADSIAKIHRIWSSDLARYVEHLGTLLLSGLGYGESQDVVASQINVAIKRALGLDASLGSEARDLELDRLCSEVAEGRPLAVLKNKFAGTPAPNVGRYALEIRAVRRAGAFTVTPIGRLVLDLSDRDARRWLLAVESVQSRGRNDLWRISRDSAAALLKNPNGIVKWIHDPDSEDLLPASWSTLARLSRLDLVQVADKHEKFSRNEVVWVESTYALLPGGRPFLEEIAKDQATPLAVLVEALLQDEASAAIGHVRSAVASVQREGAAASTARHARMVAHEIRNALVPVQVTLDTLYRDVERKGDSSLVDKHRDILDGGISRIFRFVEEMVTVAERGAEPAELFDVATAIDEAIASITSEIGRQVNFQREGKPPPVRGIRSRFVLAMINLLRNAAQARLGESVEIRVTASASEPDAGAVVTVDDSGPGVPTEYRVTIFEQGFSLRSGGTGQGLALVREVIEAEMHGRATCEESPLGGARFMLTIPASGRKGG